jgi:hypothetical protein
MSEPLGRRCALALLVAMTLAVLTGLLAFGPITLTNTARAYADSRTRIGLPNAVNVLSSLPLVFVAAWGWRATRRSRWPVGLQRAWSTFHTFAMAIGVLSAIYHVAPSDIGFLLAHVAAGGAFVFLTLGVLAERVHAGFASPRGLAAAAGIVMLTALPVARAALLGGPIDLRTFLLPEMLPVLLIPTGALSLPGAHTRSADWIGMLLAYAVGILCDRADAAVLAATGWISGHALMHLGFAAVAGWLAYCAARASASKAGDSTLRQTSLKTSG